MTTYIWHFLVMSLVGTYIIWPHFWKLGLSPDLLALVSNVALVALTFTALTIPWLLFGWIEDYAANRKLVLWPGIRFPRPIRHARRISTYREAQAQEA